MKTPIEIMLEKYNCKSVDEYKNALKEIIQEISLLALWRAKFYEHASFYGGTALRIFHHLSRFSEDLDFSLLSNNPEFKLAKYNQAIVSELKAFGFETEVITKEKEIKTSIDSVVLKANTRLQLLNVVAPKQITDRIHHQDTLTIKMEVDIDPPLDFETESKVLLNPIPFDVKVFKLPDLFATKIHAILCRRWQTRIKGRDWFDFVWYFSKKVPLRIKHLEARLIKSGVWSRESILQKNDVISLITAKINDTDFEYAKKDVIPFIRDKSSMDLWSQAFFHSLLETLQVV